jgi:hypothetical protein
MTSQVVGWSKKYMGGQRVKHQICRDGQKNRLNSHAPGSPANYILSVNKMHILELGKGSKVIWRVVLTLCGNNPGLYNFTFQIWSLRRVNQ